MDKKGAAGTAPIRAPIGSFGGCRADYGDDAEVKVGAPPHPFRFQGPGRSP